MISKNSFKYLNDFIYNKSIRRYQKDLIKNKYIEIPLNEIIEIIEITEYFDFNGVIYYCANFKNFGLLIDTGKISEAYKVNRIALFDFDQAGKLSYCELFSVDYRDENLLGFNLANFSKHDEGKFFHYSDYRFPSHKSFEKFIIYLKNENFDFFKQKIENFYIQIGHENFAHFIWNELSGILSLIQNDCAIPPLLLVDNPLGLFSWGEEIDSRLIKDEPSHSAPLRVGSRIISTYCRNYVVNQVDKSPNSQLTLANFGNLLWLSVRSGIRCPINQVEFLTGIALYWLDRHGDVILDGFTPLSLSEMDQNATRKSETDSIIQGVERLIENKHTRFNLHTTLDLTLKDALFYTKFASFYISPIGTIQHKVGWIRNIPGIIHCGVFNGRSKVNLWHSNQVEGGVTPALVPTDLVKNYNSGAAVNNRNVRYHIDVAKFINYVDQYVNKNNFFQ